MKTPRKISELLPLVLQYLEKHELESGLCLMITCMHQDRRIYKAECDLLREYIEDHRPRKGSKHYDPLYADSGWYWEPMQKEPRRAWLKDQIKYRRRKGQ